MIQRSLLATIFALAPTAIIAGSTPNPGDYVNLRDYLPIGQPDGTTDNSAGAQIVATTLCARASNGGRIYIPNPPNAAKYKIHDILNSCGNWWQGAGVSGVGDLHQPGTPTTFVVSGGASIDYSAATSYFMEWTVPNFPAFKSNAHMNGGGIDGVALIDNVSTATALVSLGTQDWKATNLVINGAYNGVYMKGSEFPVTSHISMYGTKNKNYEIVGDLSGQTQSGLPCGNNNGDCSTRDDVWFGEYLTNIDNLNTNTVFTITGFVATTTLEHTSGEGPAYGMVMTCPAGLNTNMGQCPTFGRFNDQQFENFSVYGVYITDSLNNYFDHLYSVGQGSSLGTTNMNALFVSTVNYSSSSVPPGVFELTNSQLFATGHECAYFGGTQYDIHFGPNNKVNGCGGATSTYADVNFNGTLTHIQAFNNQMVMADAYIGGSTPTRGFILGASTSWVDIHDNTFDGLTQFTNTASSSGTTINWANNQLIGGQAVSFQGSVPSGLTANTAYYVLSSGLSTSAFSVSTVPRGSAVTVGTGSNFTALATVSPVLSLSANPGTIHIHDNLGPGSTAPIIVNCGGGTPAFVGVAHDDAFTLTVGTGSPTSCDLVYSNPMWTTPTSNVSVAPGASSSGLSLAGGPAGLTLNGSALSGTYFITNKAP